MGAGITISIRCHSVVSTAPRNPNTSTHCFTATDTNGSHGRTDPVRAPAAFRSCIYSWTIPATMAGNGLPGRRATTCAGTAYPEARLRITKQLPQEKGTLPYVGPSSSGAVACHSYFSGKWELLLLR